MNTFEKSRISAGAAFEGATATQQLGHVESELREMDRLSMTLNDELSALHDRLAAVLRPSVPEPASTGGNVPPPAPIRSPYATTLGDLNLRLQHAIVRVRDIAARTDL